MGDYPDPRCLMEWGFGFRVQGLGFRVTAQTTGMIQEVDPRKCKKLAQ